MSVNTKLIVSPGPHISKGLTTRTVMLDVVIGLLPALIAAGYFFRKYAAIVVGTCVATCVITEWVCCLIRRKPNTVFDFSAVVTGIILAFSVPPMMPVPYLIIGCIFTITIGKVVFGGLGYNPFNPAMVGRAFLTACFGMAMTTWTVPATINPGMPKVGPSLQSKVVNIIANEEAETLDATTQATPLAWVKDAIKTRNLEDASKIVKANFPDSQLRATLIGYTGGCLGETSAIMILLGGLYMLIRKTITWVVPVAVIASAFIFAEVVHFFNPEVFVNPLLHITSGGLLICAFFIATDPVTNPITRKGQFLFGCGVGLLIMLIRVFGAYPEGVMYAVLIMNALSPLIDRLCKKKPYGGVINAK